ncbi:MAG: Zn-dependent protease with chaperone function [Paracoccaceae bacterium]|jgi:Zn-dependent protease with chaperone function
MTALDRYALLEAEAVYFDGRSARPRDVIVRFGETTLTLLTAQDEPVNHWALASLRQISANKAPGETEVMRLTPGHDAEERLTLTDRDMIEALRQVCPDLAAPASPPSHVARKALIWGVAAAGALALIVTVLAPMAAEQLALRMPQDRAERFGDMVIDLVAKQMGDGDAAACAAPDGVAALSAMTARLTPADGWPRPIRVQVRRAAVQNAITAPGGRIVLFSGIIDNAGSPEEVAAVLAHEIAHAEARDPLRESFRVIGTTGLLGLAVGDYAGGAVVATLGDALISGAYRREAEAAADARALEMLAAAGLPGGAMAQVFDRFAAQGPKLGGMMSHLASHPDSAGRADAARAADTVGTAPFTPALEDAQWIALQQICD